MRSHGLTGRRRCLHPSLPRAGWPRRAVRAAAVLLPALYACGDRTDATPGSAPDEARGGGTVVVAYFADFPALDVLHTFDALAIQVQRYMLYVPLLNSGAGARLEPRLAASWDTVHFAPDSVALTFHLRTDVHWHDGTPTTAEDVRFTFERIIDPRTAAVAARLFAHYHPRAEVLDPHTIRFRLRAHGGFLAAWGSVPPLPSHRLAEVPPDRLATDPFGRAPLGNGPFIFAGRQPGREWVFDANPAFPEALGGRPSVDRVVIRAVPEETARVVELRNGRIHVAAVSSVHASDIRAAPELRLNAFPTTRWTALFWNTALPHFADVRVRRALTMAIDRRALTDALLQGGGTAGRASVPPFHPFHADADPLTALPHDPDSARVLLAAAGWRDSRGDGTLHDGDGAPFNFTISVMSASSEHSAAAEIIRSDLGRVGVRAEVRRVEYNTLIQQAMRGNSSAQPEAMIMSVAGEPRKDDSFLFHSRHLDAGGRFYSYTHPRLDTLLDTLAISEHDERMDGLWLEYQTLLAQEAPVSVLYYPDTHIAVASALSVRDMDGHGLLRGVARWRFDRDD